MSGEGRTVCVTGASGYVASWLVKLLLHHGYTVKATVRDPNDMKKTGHLWELDGAKERLHLLKASLLEEDSFDAAVSGCEGVFHTASPALFSVNDPQAELIDPAVKGTLNILKACAKVPSIKRVVITSSMACMMFSEKTPSPEEIMDETWESDLGFCESIQFWYPISKILAEAAAWKFKEENGIDIVTINPGLVVGPLLQPTLNGTSEFFLKHIKGDEAFSRDALPLVDVRDVAKAHIRAFELPSVTGRYCLVERVVHSLEIVKIVLDHYPSLRDCSKFGDEKAIPATYKVSKERAKTLGIDFTPIEESLVDTIDSFKAKGFLHI